FNQQVISSSQPVFVVFVVDWCTSCRTLLPILEEFSSEAEGQVLVFSIDVGKYQDIAARFDIKSLPTLVLFREGEEIDRFSGLRSKDLLHEMLNLE
ncbi:thioredoxin family protein, partial [Patescibacteria group bacterium]